ncbi:MAG: DUF3021 domain-containing protein [Treponema sp.]|nr:DUF3021 domain-containing protein [Treponema sp.]
MTKKEIKKAIAKRAVLGFIYGVFIGQTILIIESLFMRDGNFYAVSASLLELAGTKIAAVIIQYFLTGIIGLTFASTTVIFEMDEWSLLRQSITHFIITSIVMYIAGFLCGWFPHTVGSTLVWFGVFVVVYLIFWVCFSLYYKNKVKKINDAL